jgi:hypothetical protein
MGPGKYENIGKSQPVLIVDGPIISPRTRIHSHRHLVTLTGAPETHHRARSTGDAMASGLELIPNASAENPYMQETVRPGNPPPNQMPLPTSAPPASQPASPSVGRSCTTPPPPQHAGNVSRCSVAADAPSVIDTFHGKFILCACRAGAPLQIRQEFELELELLGDGVSLVASLTHERG